KPRDGRAPRDRRAEAKRGSAGVVLGRISDRDYAELRAPLPSLELSFDEPASPGALLRQLGTPAIWTSKASPAELLAPVVRAASAHARALAASESAASPETPETSDPPRTSRSGGPGTKRRRRAREKDAAG